MEILNVQENESKRRNAVAAYQAKLIIAAREYLRTGSREDAAKKIGVALSTMYRYERDPLYIKTVNQHVKESYGNVSLRARYVLPKALGRLEKLMDSEDENIQLKACVQLFGIVERLKLNDPTEEDAKLTVALVQKVIDSRPELRAAFAEALKEQQELLDVELEEGEGE